MEWILQFLNVALGSLRFGGFLVSSPIFSLASIPTQIRVLLAVGIGFAISHHVPPIDPALWDQPSILLLLIIKEIGLGFLIGFSMRLAFLVGSLAMELIGLQIGFNMANVIDPTNNSQASILSQLSIVLMVIYVFASNLHHEIIWTLYKSYDQIPMGLMDWNFSAFMGRILLFLRLAMETGIRMSFPVMIAMLVFHIIMGVIAKTAPQLNIFFNLSFVVNLLAGMALIIMNWSRLFPTVQSYLQILRNRGFGLW